MNGLLSTWVLVTEVHCHEYVGRVGAEFVREGFMTVELGLGVRIAVLANVGAWMSKLPEELPEAEEEAVYRLAQSAAIIVLTNSCVCTHGV